LEQEPTREQKIEECLREILRQPDFPAISQHIQQLMLALQDEEASFRYLTSLVLRDYSLTLKVLRAANSAQYNRSGRPILSVSHAVVLLGAEAIRYLAGSLALFDHFRQRSPGLKELMLLSLLTANEARAVAGTLQYPRREEAYLCGMLCNLGEVLIACYFPQQYAAILRLAQEEKLAPREACLRVLHFTYEDLGHAVARRWNIPEPVRCCIRDLETKPPKGTLDHADLLSNLISFSHGLTTAVYRQDREGARARVQWLIEDYLPVLPLRKDDVDRVLESALLDTKNTFSLLRIPLDSLRLNRQVEAAVAGTAEAAPTPDETIHEFPELPTSADLLEPLTREAELLLASPDDFELNHVLLMILEAVYRGGPFDRVLFCLVNAEHTFIQGRLALGEGAEELRQKFRWPLSTEGGPIGAALRSKRALFLPSHGVGFAEVKTLKTLGVVSLGVLPILVEGVLVGCLYFDRVRDRTMPDAQMIERLEKLRDLAAAAIERSRRTPAVQ